MAATGEYEVLQVKYGERVTQKSVARCSSWIPATTMLELDREFLDSYTRFSGVPWRQNHLPDKAKEFIYSRNRVVDAIGDVAGGVRLHDGPAGPAETKGSA